MVLSSYGRVPLWLGWETLLASVVLVTDLECFILDLGLEVVGDLVSIRCHYDACFLLGFIQQIQVCEPPF